MKRNVLVILILVLGIFLTGCRAIGSEGPEQQEEIIQEQKEAKIEKPVIPEKLDLNQDGIPILKVYKLDDEETAEIDLETYLEGVLAGEMKNDWPMEALKAQAILARTFVLKFCTEKESKYEGADISTDIEEAQAYDETGINERISQAVQETRGMVLSYRGELPYAWFHAHSGGKTALAKEGLAYRDDEPGYTQVTDGMESDQAPEEAKEWTANFTHEEILRAAKEAGQLEMEELDSVEIGEKGESGRITTILINGNSVSAPDLRIALGSTKMRSTMITHLEMKDDTVVIRGKGYGHGVGMPQWGAYGLAEAGKNAEEIVKTYFRDIHVQHLW